MHQQGSIDPSFCAGKAFDFTLPTRSRRGNRATEPLKGLLSGQAGFRPQVASVRTDASPRPQWRPRASGRTIRDQPARSLPTRAAPLGLTRPAVLPSTDRHDPACPAGITFQATGIAHPLRTTLIAKIVHRLPSDVASITSGKRRFSLCHKRNTHPSKGAKHVDTSSSRRFFPLFCPA